ncbi:hypothetical protein OO013_12215 [Mangrovivirga sp. M17]|uniref:Uncharacterized protein n=1 Tax=Mangrovivirga halotolerans TaxID=2993936 RepID=A0ABT3RS74_9BACT|nr:hypothetical protein [Mangrovivirga halotolerans]MCX2744638.1 hypothetical protein [Mangrovivirga halotolerans]
MKRVCFTLFVALFLFNNHTNAQKGNTKYDLKWGEKQRRRAEESFNHYAGHDESGHYIVNVQALAFNTKTYFVKLDNDLNEVKEEQFKVKVNGKKCTIQKLIFLNGQLTAISSVKNKETNGLDLVAHKVNKNTFEVDESDYKILGRMENTSILDENYGIYINLSSDTSKIAITTANPTDPNENAFYTFEIFDSNLQSLWKKDLELPVESKLAVIKNIRVSNDGNIHLLYKEYYEKKESFLSDYKGNISKEYRKKVEPNYTYKILSVRNNGDKGEVNIRDNDEYFYDLALKLDNAGNVICTGYFSRLKPNNVAGIYFLKINSESGRILKRVHNDLPQNVISLDFKYRNDVKSVTKDKENEANELKHFDLDYLRVLEDGNIILTGEFHHVNSVYVSPTENKYYHHIRDIMIIKLSPEGEIVWGTKIAKDQRDKYLGSYNAFVNGNDIYLLYNGTKANIDLEPGDKIYSTGGYNGYAALLVRVDANAKVEKSVLFEKDEVDLYFKPIKGNQLDENQRFIYTMKGRKECFLLLKLRNSSDESLGQ